MFPSNNSTKTLDIRVGKNILEFLREIDLASCDISKIEECIKINAYTINYQEKKLIITVYYGSDTALLFAVKNNRPDIVSLLIKYGADLSLEYTSKKLTILMYAIVNQHTNCFDALLENGDTTTFLDKQDSEGRTALIYAIGCACYDFSKKLIAYGANIHIRNLDGLSALNFAISTNYIPFVELLVKNGAKLNVSNEDEQSLLLYAVHDRTLNFEMMEQLIKYGADLNTRVDHFDNTILMYLIIHDKPNYYQYAKLILKHHPNIINQENNRGETALDIALENDNNRKIYIMLLMTHGINIRARRYASGNTILIRLIYHNCYDIAKKMIESHNIKLNEGNDFGFTALNFAFTYNKPDYIRLLVKNGASLNIKNDDNENTTLMYLVKYDHHDYAEILLNKMCAKDNTYILSQNLQGENVLNFIFDYERFHFMDLISQYGVDINIPLPNQGDKNMIMLCISRGYFTRLEKIITKYNVMIDLNFKNYKNQSALSLALDYCAKIDRLSYVKLLLDNGAQVDGIHTSYDQILDLSILHADIDMVFMMLKKGAKISNCSVTKNNTNILCHIRKHLPSLYDILFENEFNFDLDFCSILD